MKNKLLGFVIGLSFVACLAIAQDWYVASGKPIARSALNSADMRTEFSSIETDIADQLPALTGNGDKAVVVNSGGTALTVATGGIAVSAGGTGATTAAAARTSLGLVIGTDVQAFDAELLEIAGLANTDSNFIVGNGSAWVAESGATARTSIGADSAANLTTGELPDARLSANVPLLNAANTFSDDLTVTQVQSGTNGLISQSAIAGISIYEDDQAADEGFWKIFSNGTGLLFATATDLGASSSTFIDVDRTGTTVDTINLTATAIQNNGVEATHANGSFTATWDTACTTNPSDTWKWAKAGEIVTIMPQTDGINCTSDSSSFQATADVPAEIRPAIAKTVSFGFGENSGSLVRTCLRLATDGNINSGVVAADGSSCSVVGWTASGAKAGLLSVITYHLN